MDSLLHLFCHVDDFCHAFLPVWEKQLLASGAPQRQRQRSIAMSGIMTILVHFRRQPKKPSLASEVTALLPAQTELTLTILTSRIHKSDEILWRCIRQHRVRGRVDMRVTPHRFDHSTDLLGHLFRCSIP